MAEPTSTAVATLMMASAAAPALGAFGVEMGLRSDVLFAGFCGALVSIALLNTVPATGDTWRELVRTTLRRAFVAVAGSATAGYLVPAMLGQTKLATLLACSFVVGAGAQKILIIAIEKFGSKGSIAP